MNDKDKRFLFNLAYWIMILVVIGVGLFLVIYLNGNGGACISDPIKYYAERTGTQCFCIKNPFIP